MKQKILQIERIFNQDEEIEIIEPLKLQDEYWIKGKIRVVRKLITLDFNIEIPKIYPLTIPYQNNLSIRFISTFVSGYAYTFADNSLCIHPPKSSNLQFKLLAEIDLVKEWIDKYYINELPNTRYTFLPYHFEEKDKTNLIYTDSLNEFDGGEYGHFEYILLSKHKQSPFKFNAENLVCLNQGKKGNEWSKQFKSYFKRKSNEVKKGIWIFLNEELNVANNNINRQLPINWQELENYLDEKSKFLIYKTYFYKQRQLNHNGEILLMLGYRIKVNNAIQWQLVKMDFSNCPVRLEKFPLQNQVLSCRNLNIKWSNVENVSYNKYFGRGKLSLNLTEANILIVGIGAIGSILSELLVRGGCKNIDIIDFDHIQSGNICRSNYELTDIGKLKTTSTLEKLIKISPFINVRIGFKEFPKVLSDDRQQYLNIKREFNKYDFIFDCSSDTDVLLVLDNLRLKSTVLSLSITNKANDLVCVTGSNLALRKDFRFNQLEADELDLYEDVGCGYSTFRASYNDISTLVQYSLKKINKQLENQISLNTFVLNCEEDENGFKITVNDY